MKRSLFFGQDMNGAKRCVAIAGLVLTSVVQSCASSDKSSMGSAQAGATGTAGGSSAAICAAGPALIDDFADGDGFLNAPRQGYWGAVNDRSEAGIQSPIDGTRGAGFPASDDGTGNFALHTTGSGFKSWALVDAVFDCSAAYDASSFTGIQFRIKGKVSGGTARLEVPTPQTTEIQFSGTCASNCNDHFGAQVQYTPDWQTVTLHWSDLKQSGVGAPATFDARQIRGLEWNFNSVNGSALSFDVWIDDVTFTAD